MQIEIFTICDSAHVYAGKAVISGSFNKIVAKKLPVVMSNLTLAVRVAFDSFESGDKTFYFTIKNPDGSVILPEFRCDTKFSPEKHSPLMTIDISIILGSITFTQFGLYTVSMRYENRIFILKFFVEDGGNKPLPIK